MFPDGEVLSDRYHIQSFLGAGAFGEVYKAHSTQYGDVALKVFRLEAHDATAVNLLKEAQMLAEMEHPQIVKVYEVGKHTAEGAEYGYIATEYLGGGTLAAYLERRIRLPVGEACCIGCDILQALAFAHDLKPPVLHGDVKPDNVLLASEEPVAVKLADFGLSTQVCPDTGLTTAGGTVYYMAPECLWGYGVPASDVFSAGMVIYRMLTGTTPFGLTEPGDDAHRAIEKSRQLPPTPPSEFSPEIGQDLECAILRSLALDRNDRYSSATEFLKALRPFAISAPAFEPAVPSAQRRQDSIPVFGLPEYRDLACSGDLSNDDLDALWELYCDLETPVSVEQQGAFSVVTLTGLTRTELSGLGGRSLRQWLFSPDISISELRILKDIGKLLFSNPCSVRANRSGMVLYAAAIARAFDRFGERISRMSADQLHELCDQLLTRPYLPTHYRTLLSSVLPET